MTLVFDTETTGLIMHPHSKDAVQPHIIEFGGVLFHEGEPISELELLINPGVPISEKITKITGITEADVANAPTFEQAAPQIRELFSAAEILVAHNLPFDTGMIKLELARAGIMDWPWPRELYCTVQEHAEEWGRRPKLTELYKWYFNEPLAQTHRALDDVHALARIAEAAGLLR